jgi:hypothetical protein
MNNFCKILAVSTFFISMNFTTLNAQFTGYTVELDTIFLEEGSDLEFFGTYRVYANLTNENDAINALFSDVGALDTPLMFIDAPCGCHNPVDGSSVMGFVILFAQKTLTQMDTSQFKIYSSF